MTDCLVRNPGSMARRIGGLAALLVAFIAVLDWPIQISGQRFRWTLALLLVYLGSRYGWWLNPPRPAAGVLQRALCVFVSFVLATLATLKLPAVIAGLAADQGFHRSVEVEERNGWFEEIVMTRHDPFTVVGMYRYEVARRFHCGPVGVAVPLGSIHAKYAPDVVLAENTITFTSYNGVIRVPL